MTTLSTTPERHLLRWVLNATDFTCDTVAAMGGRVLKNERVAAADLGRPAGFFNSATLLRRPRRRELVVTLAELDRFYSGGAPRGIWLWAAWPTPDLSALGWRPGEGPTLMLREPGDEPLAESGLEVREVVNDRELRAWETTAAHGFGFDGHRAGALIKPRALADGRLRLMLAWDGDRPVATASSFSAHGVNHVNYVATVPEARERGYGSAVIAAAAGLAPELPAMLLSAAAARPLLDRLGFEAVGRFTEWVRA